MNRIANNINNRLSLRAPQTESLEILAGLAEELNLEKSVDLSKELAKVKSLYPICTDFEREFPSICFALATGVGKTRLMGAFITYLYLAKGIKNFFVMAPNLTIYNKLREDFSNPNNPKFVFQGIGEFAQTPPRVVTGDNYQYESIQDAFSHKEVTINVFNISKLNAEARGGKEPRIKRLSEYIGDSYFNYLSELDDLVLLMDESHHYRADRGMTVINELNPILGLELTATPKIEKSGGKSIKFKNVVFEYSLAKAIEDGFVKEPAVATRKDFDPSQYSISELDRIKLEDGIRIHEDTKVNLEIYANNNKVNQVKPFVLVVAKDTAHASELKEIIVSQGFFRGYYSDKVVEIHSNQRGSEKDENIELLISLENINNKIEIVIHVNMLKEGWDVTNLYTIVPLRTSASETLTEQTIGRGLRLPYGKTTGEPKVDKLTIVAHDKFQAILDKANEPDSLIKQKNIIQIDEEELKEEKVVIVSSNNIQNKLQQEREEISLIPDKVERQKKEVQLSSKSGVVEIINSMNNSVSKVTDFKNTDVKKEVLNKYKETVAEDLFKEDLIKEAEKAYESVAEEIINNIIEIPRITVLASEDVDSGFNDFNLNTFSLNFQPVTEEIFRKSLKDGQSDFVSSKRRFIRDTTENIIVTELMDCPEIDYDEQSELLYKLANQAITKFKTYLKTEEEIDNVVQYNKREIGKLIYSQMMEHFYCEEPDYVSAKVCSFTQIEEHNYSKLINDNIHYFRDTITPTKSIPSKLFNGFDKACHTLYKFDSKTEKDFAIILEDDKSVLKWLRPAKKQFHIYWKHNSKQYEPDFVVETDNTIYLIETKKAQDINSSDVQDKARAALIYCKNASDYAAKVDGKPWKYIIVPHDEVMQNMSFDNLVKKFEYK